MKSGILSLPCPIQFLTLCSLRLCGKLVALCPRCLSPRSRLLALIFLSILLSCCHEPQRCRNVTTWEEISPNGQLKAVTFRRLCPEQHSITTHVSIIRADQPLPDGNGNVFGYDNEIAIRVSWLSNARLAVYTYADPAKATKIERAGNVSIEYSRVIETALVPPIPNSISQGTPANPK